MDTERVSTRSPSLKGLFWNTLWTRPKTHYVTMTVITHSRLYVSHTVYGIPMLFSLPGPVVNMLYGSEE
jgi:hypothetical protein